MPAPVKWKIRYPLRNEDEELIFRHHLHSLKHDANVEQVEVIESEEQPKLVELAVVFAPGYAQPATPELYALNQRFPRIEVESLYQRILRDDLF